MIHALMETMKGGGPWLGAVRGWLQWNKYNGDKVTWGSDEMLLPPITVREVEQIGLHAAAAERQRIVERLRNHQTRCSQKADAFREAKNENAATQWDLEGATVGAMIEMLGS